MSVDKISLIPAGPDDHETLSLVASATFLECFAGVLPGKAIVAHCLKNHSADTYAKYLAMPACRVWLAVSRHGGAPVGYVMLSDPDLPLPGLGPEDIELKRIYLFSRFHGSGAGQMLADKAIQEAVAMGKKRLLLGVYAGNARAISFYRRNGFAVVGERTFYVGEQRCEDFIFGKALDDSSSAAMRAY